MSKSTPKQSKASKVVPAAATGIEPTPAPAASGDARSKPPKQAPAPAKATKSTPKPSTVAVSKLEKVITLLKGKNGATLEQLGKATGWQAHSIRGAISGAIKKRHGLSVTSQLRDGCRTYRIEQ